MGLITLVAKKWRSKFAIIALFASALVCTSTATHAEDPFISVCERNEMVRNSLQFVRFFGACDQISRAELREIVQISLEIRSIDEWENLNDSDFADLINVRSLLIRFPRAQFDNFGDFQRALPLFHIKRGKFKQLTKLAQIKLFGLTVISIEDDAFADLPNIFEVRLEGPFVKNTNRAAFTGVPNVFGLREEFDNSNQSESGNAWD